MIFYKLKPPEDLKKFGVNQFRLWTSVSKKDKWISKEEYDAWLKNWVENDVWGYRSNDKAECKEYMEGFEIFYTWYMIIKYTMFPIVIGLAYLLINIDFLWVKIGCGVILLSVPIIMRLLKNKFIGNCTMFGLSAFAKDYENRHKIEKVE